MNPLTDKVNKKQMKRGERGGAFAEKGRRGRRRDGKGSDTWKEE